jgi:APA family basic amino acid/polyamine antiporter
MLRTMANEAKFSGPYFRKALSVFDGIAILIGITIGAGIYSTPQIIARYLSSFDSIIILWLLAGFFVFTSGLIYAELGTRMPNTGGEYVYISRCFGPFAGFMFGWAQLFIIRTSAAAGLALIVADYFGYFVALNGVTKIITALAVIFLLGILNYIGIQRASVFQNISTILKVGALMAIVVVGILFSGGHENLLSTRAAPEGSLSPLKNVVAALMLIIFSHTGWERIGYPAGEMKNPRRVIPLSLVVGIGLVVLLYALTNLTYHRILGMEGMRDSEIVASDVLTVLVGPVGAALIAVLVIISATGSINGTMMTAPRAYYAMSRDGLFFKWLDHVHPRFRTPSRAIVAHCLWGGSYSHYPWDIRDDSNRTRLYYLDFLRAFYPGAFQNEERSHRRHKHLPRPALSFSSAFVSVVDHRPAHPQGLFPMAEFCRGPGLHRHWNPFCFLLDSKERKNHQDG